MVWSIEGRAKNIKLGLRQSGVLYVHGDGEHKLGYLSLDHHSPAQLARISAAECCWSFYPSNASDVDLDPNGKGLLQLVRDAPEQTHISAQFFDNPPLVSFMIVLPPARLSDVIGLFRMVLLSDQLQFGININFSGFRVEYATTLTPTATEFMSGRPYLTCNEMTLSIGHRFGDA